MSNTRAGLVPADCQERVLPGPVIVVGPLVSVSWSSPFSSVIARCAAVEKLTRCERDRVSTWMTVGGGDSLAQRSVVPLRRWPHRIEC